MSAQGRVKGRIRSLIELVRGEVRTVRGEEQATPHARLIAFVVLASLITVVACTVKVVYRQTHRLKLATGALGSEYYSFGMALEDVIERHNPKIEIELVTDTAGSHDSVGRVYRNEVQLALAQNDTPAEESVKSIALLFEEVFHLYVRGDSGIERMDQLKGKRIATLPEGSGTACCLRNLLAHFESDDGFEFATVEHVKPDRAHAMFHEGRVDAVFHIIALGQTAKDYIGRSLEEGARLLPLEQVRALKVSHPFLEAAVIPAGFYRGHPADPEEDVETAALRAVLLAHSSVEKHVVHDITRTLYEHRNELVKHNHLAASIRQPEKPEEVVFPVHAGAKAFYDREKPSFIVIYAEPIALCLSVAVLIASGLWRLQIRLAQRRKDRADRYNLEILDLVTRLRGVESQGELDEIRQNLFDIFKRVVRDVADDRISGESFQLFAFPWEMAICTIRHRELVLSDQSDVEKHSGRAAPFRQDRTVMDSDYADETQ